MFRRAHATYTKELNRILRFKGGYTGRVIMLLTEAVFSVLNSEDCPQWPDELFQRTVFDERSAAYMLQQRLIPRQYAAGSTHQEDVRTADEARNRDPTKARDQEEENQQAYTQGQARLRDQISQQSEQRQRPAGPIQDTIEHTPQPNRQRYQTQQPPSIYNNFDRFRQYTPVYPQRPKGPSIPPIEPSGETDPYKAVPPIEFDNEKLELAKINTFAKIWDRDKKYTGKPYDLLDDKLKIFYSICYHADI